MTQNSTSDVAERLPEISHSFIAASNDERRSISAVTTVETPRRFNDIKRTIGGISQQMLARTLRALERDGMVARTVHSTLPPQVEYALTALGRSLADPIRELGYWAGAHIAEIESNRSAFDEARNSQLLA